MRICLVTTPARTRKVNYVLPSGVIALAAYLEHCGHDVRIVDAALSRESFEDVARHVADFEPQLIGISAIITAYAYMLNLSKALRTTLPATPQVLGGQIVINNTRNCFLHAPLDFIIHGYGEFALEKLVRHLQGELELGQIPGISYRHGNMVLTNPGREFFKHLDNRPLPAYHLVDMEHYSGALAGQKRGVYTHHGYEIADPRTLPVFGTLGCTDRCSFCVHEQEFVGIKFSSNLVLIEHLKFLNSKYGINIFNMGEEMFISKYSRAKEFNDLMKEHLPHCCWRATTRADFVTPEVIAELKTGNCLSIGWGYESGSQRMLDLMNKRMTVAINNRAYTLANKAGLYEGTTIMVGHVGETNDTVRETLVNVRKTRMDRASVFIAAVYPGGRSWDWAVEEGLIQDTHAYLVHVSDRDASQFNINLTNYPDFVVTSWKLQVEYAVERNARHKHPDHLQRLTTRWGIRHLLKSVARDMFRAFVAPLATTAFCFLYDAMLAVLPGGLLRRHAYRMDSHGALMPSHLLVGKPQSFMSEQRIQEMMSSTQVSQEPLENL